MKISTAQPIILHRDKITRKIARFWDQISEGWREIWGPHIHHGYYEDDHAVEPLAAQELLIDKLATLLQIAPEEKILDVGCGMGGSSLYLAENYQAIMTGITLSPKQVALASQQAQEKNIKNVSFKIEDALTLDSLDDHSFDCIWSLESCEQFHDKSLFIQQAFRVLKPGGKLILATWCSDQEEYNDKLARKYQKLCLAFDLPYMPTINHYQNLLAKQQFSIKETLDWTSNVERSWDIGLSRLSSYSFLQLLRMGGWRGFRFARQTKMMREAFHQNRVQYAVFLAIKA
ncbi:Demethylrebeccamycin-D-glucose O-methyltransferase [Legionella massiliensis]|uniref:Demethylrebeccamycin-D-glucose O-methyltransferase n=1 Tax=Legionella massiliensis TaxID=1034943 RepID=A0A078KTG4_9GAMM|nr:methyltransferase domain-containing protein [Legionella massiliensis]CDZ76257.1 Demethylrebeccamycin-D-glucose O-methyltransferase [Legionella massiliensis]CEE11995.1 Demethylrebeccamycin-D-glucose O-methyltransferase [Legionella massiliensis]